MARNQMAIRRQANKQINLDNLRDKLSFARALNMIEQCEAELMDMGKPQVLISEDTGEEYVVPGRTDAARVAALKTVMDSNWKKIAKLLPDAKVIDQIAQEAGRQLDSEEMKRKLMSYFARQGLLALPEPEEELPSFLK